MILNSPENFKAQNYESFAQGLLSTYGVAECNVCAQINFLAHTPTFLKQTSALFEMGMVKDFINIYDEEDILGQ